MEKQEIEKIVQKLIDNDKIEINVKGLGAISIDTKPNIETGINSLRCYFFPNQKFERLYEKKYKAYTENLMRSKH